MSFDEPQKEIERHPEEPLGKLTVVFPVMIPPKVREREMISYGGASCATAYLTMLVNKLTTACS